MTDLREFANLLFTVSFCLLCFGIILHSKNWKIHKPPMATRNDRKTDMFE